MAQKMHPRTNFLIFGIASLQAQLWTEPEQRHWIPQDPHAQVYSNILAAVLHDVPGASLSAFRSSGFGTESMVGKRGSYIYLTIFPC